MRLTLIQIAFCNHTPTLPQIVHGMSRHDVIHSASGVTTLVPSSDETYVVEHRGADDAIRSSTTAVSSVIGESVFPDMAPPSVVMPNTGGQPRHNSATSATIGMFLTTLSTSVVALAIRRTIS